MLMIGCHLSSSKGHLDMVHTAQKIGANTFAYFTRNPRGSRAKALDPDECRLALDELKAHGFAPLVAHGSYTMNLCTADPEARKFAAEVFAEDLKRMSVMPGQYYNFHPGSHVGQGMQVGIDHISQAIRSAMEPDYPVTVLLETMAGKGSEVGGRFQELRQIIDAVGRKDIGVCLDTCHVYDAGYDIVQNLDGVLAEFDRIIGIDRLKALHLNDSKNPIGSHKDRHERIGSGSIGLEGFQRIINHPLLRDKPIILETPNELSGYAEEIKVLRAMFKDS